MNNEITFISPDFDTESEEGYPERDTDHYFTRDAEFLYDTNDQEDQGRRAWSVTIANIKIHSDDKTENITPQWKCKFQNLDWEIVSALPDKPFAANFIHLKIVNNR